METDVKVNVIKRNGEEVSFDLLKIANAIKAANQEVAPIYQLNEYQIQAIADNVAAKISEMTHAVHVEDIQDSVETVLEQAGYTDVAKAYILYRKQREKMRNMKSTILNYKEIVDSYVKVEDWRVKENSTVTYSVGGLILSNSGAVTANYWLSEIYDE